MFSRFVQSIKVESAVALYHTTKIKVIFVSESAFDEVEAYLKGSQSEEIRDELLGLVEELKSEEFLIANSAADDEYLNGLRSSCFAGPRIGVLYLLMTEECNFRCKYCFIENSMPTGYENSMMTKETARKAIDTFMRVSDVNIPKKTVIFYGGEPLINWDTLHWILHYLVEEYGEVPLELNLITNGSLISPEIARELHSHGVSVSVSIDGPSTVNDKNRIDAGGRPTSQLVERGIGYLKHEKVNFGLSCTITSDNVIHLEDHFSWLCKQFGPSSMGLNMLMDSIEVGSQNESYYELASKGIVNCFKFARELGIREDRAMRKVDAFTESKIHIQDCAGCGGQIVIAPDGSIGICQAFVGTRQYFVGDVGDPYFEPTKEPVFQEWANRSPLNQQECESCIALGICGGGCAHNAYLKHGTIWSLDDGFCVQSKVLLDFLIHDLYHQMKEIGEGLDL